MCSHPCCPARLSPATHRLRRFSAYKRAMASGAASTCGASQPARRLRLRKKTAVRKTAFTKSQRPAWFPGIFSALPAGERACVVSFAASFRKAASMDFYINKYQGKLMESMTPFFQCMTDGVMRLQAQEQEEQKAAEEAAAESPVTYWFSQQSVTGEVVAEAERIRLEEEAAA